MTHELTETVAKLRELARKLEPIPTIHECEFTEAGWNLQARQFFAACNPTTILALCDAAVPQWQDISTAPKDGTPVLAYSTEGVQYVAWFHKGNAAWVYFQTPSMGIYSFHPTHWMPLPPEPAP